MNFLFKCVALCGDRFFLFLILSKMDPNPVSAGGGIFKSTFNSS